MEQADPDFLTAGQRHELLGWGVVQLCDGRLDLAAVSSRTFAPLLMTLLTVIGDTPANWATSLILALARCLCDLWCWAFIVFPWRRPDAHSPEPENLRYRETGR